MFVRIKKVGNNSYIQIVESRRDGKTVRQHVVATLGKADEMIESGKLDSMARSLLKHTKAVQVLDAHRDGALVAHQTRSIGPALVFNRLWKDLGLPSVFDKLLAGTRFQFPVERAVFLTVLHRLFCPGSDRAAERWKDDFVIPGAEEISLHHMYRAMDWLGRRSIQLGSDHFTNRCTKDEVEELLFARNKDLFTELDLVFFDTTSIYFEGEGGQEPGRRGHSKDSRQDLPQMVVGAILDGRGRPICCEMWPGNVTDVTTLQPVVKRLTGRFGIPSLCIVADRGMVSKDTIEKLESSEFDLRYILGVRMRKLNIFKDQDFTIDDSFVEVTPPRTRSSDPSPLKVSERTVDGKRYIICYNEEQARKDRHDRQAIIESLRQKLRESDKNLVGNMGYRKFLAQHGADHFVIDEEKVKDDARFDGIWILTTNMADQAPDIARHYKELWMVEDVFRSVKTILRTRPIYHHNDDSIRGHVFCSFLALMLLKELESRLAECGQSYEWQDIKRDLAALQQIDVSMNGEPLTLRTELHGCCGEVFKAAGVAIPQRVQSR